MSHEFRLILASTSACPTVFAISRKVRQQGTSITQAVQALVAGTVGTAALMLECINTNALQYECCTGLQPLLLMR